MGIKNIHKIKPTNTAMLKSHYLHTTRNTSCLFYVAFPDVFIILYIRCLLYGDIDTYELYT